MPMQVVFPISMIAVGIAGAGGLVVVCNRMLYHKNYRPVMTDDFDEDMMTRDQWVRRQNAIIREMRATSGL